MNKILERQLKKVFGNLDSVPINLGPLLRLVSDAYDHAEEDRLLIERSLEISSRELGSLNERTRQESEKLKLTVNELERMNNLMVDRELKMMELKEEIKTLKGGSSMRDSVTKGGKGPSKAEGNPLTAP